MSAANGEVVPKAPAKWRVAATNLLDGIADSEPVAWVFAAVIALGLVGVGFVVQMMLGTASVPSDYYSMWRELVDAKVQIAGFDGRIADAKRDATVTLLALSESERARNRAEISQLRDSNDRLIHESYGHFDELRNSARELAGVTDAATLAGYILATRQGNGGEQWPSFESMMTGARNAAGIPDFVKRAGLNPAIRLLSAFDGRVIQMLWMDQLLKGSVTAKVRSDRHLYEPLVRYPQLLQKELPANVNDLRQALDAGYLGMAVVEKTFGIPQIDKADLEGVQWLLKFALRRHSESGPKAVRVMQIVMEEVMRDVFPDGVSLISIGVGDFRFGIPILPE